MPDKDPQSYSALQYAWVFGLAVLGGAAGYLQKIRANGDQFKIAHFASEMVTSSLAGVLAFFLCEVAGIDGLISAILIAIAGHMGGEFVTLIKGGIWSKYADRMGISSQQNRKDGE